MKPTPHVGPSPRVRELVLAAVLGLALLACGGGSPTPPTPPASGGDIDLLARGPDAVFDEPGVLVPHPETEWGRLGLTGWYKAALEDPAKGIPLHVPTNQPIAILNLPATGPGARTITMELWCPDAPEDSPRTAVVRLNELPLVAEGVKLSAEPGTITIDTPAEAWHLGENLLKIEAPRREKGWCTVCVSRVEYGIPRHVEVSEGSPRTITLPPSTGLRYFVEAAPRSRLSLRGRASGPGTLRVELGSMDPETGVLEREDPVSFAASDGAVNAFASVSSSLEGVLHVELAWEAEGASELVIEELVVAEPKAVPRPPIVFISIDTFAARHMAMYGYDRETTPILERFAEEAVVFDRCVANAPWTMPSYLSALTGLYPSSHLTDVKSMPGRSLNNYDFWQVAENRWTMAEMLRGRGYQTGGFVDTEWLLDKFRIAQGFDTYDTLAATLPFDNPAYGIVFVANRFAEWLDARDREAPFFAFLHALDAHGPFWPELPFKYHYQGDLPKQEREVLSGEAEHMTSGAIPEWMGSTLLGPIPGWRFVCPDHDEPRPVPPPAVKPVQSVDRIIARYDECLLKCDWYIGVIFDMLRARGLYDEAMIVITGDHGESFDHDFYGHGRLWEDIIHVPLLIKMPGGAFGGSRVSPSVELVDLYPTMLEVAGVETARGYLHGRSLIPLMRGDSVPSRPTFSEGGHLDQCTLGLDGWKLVRSWPGGATTGIPTLLTHRFVPEDWLRESFPELVDGPLTDAWLSEQKQRPGFEAKIAELRALIPGPYTELYHLTEDPGELHDVAAEHPEIVERLEPLLEACRRRAREAREKATWKPFVKHFDDETLARLRDHGYIDGQDDGK